MGSGVQTSLDEMISTLNQLSERFGGFTTKTYNMLGVTLLLKGDVDRALKIFENAVNELQLDTPEGEKLLVQKNPDLGCLLYNYLKCLNLKNGQGQGIEYFKNDPTTKQLFGYLVKIDQDMGKSIFEERGRAEEMFDQALSRL